MTFFRRVFTWPPGCGIGYRNVWLDTIHLLFRVTESTAIRRFCNPGCQLGV